MPRRLLFWLGLMLLAGTASAQPVRQVEVFFERDVNRYRWVADARVEQPVGAWTLRLANRFTSDAFQLFGDRFDFRDENRLAWSAERPLSARFTARARGQASWFSQSRVFFQEAYGALRLAPLPYAWIEPAVGAAWDQRPGALVPEGSKEAPLRRDAGPALAARLYARPPALDAYSVEVRAQSTWHLITPRRGRALGGQARAERQFGTSRVGFSADYASLRRDAYQAASFLNRDVASARTAEAIEATTSDTLLLRLDLDTPLTGPARLTAQLDYEGAGRFVRALRTPADVLFFDTDFDRRSAAAQAALVVDEPRLTGRLGVRLAGEVETRALTNRDDLPPVQAAQKANLLRQADYTSSLFALQGQVRADPFQRTTVYFDGTASILRHDTPDVNPDDRDEVYHYARLGARLRLSRYLAADLQAFGSYVHTVYLDAARSAENTKQRSLRLRPGVAWTPSPRTRLRLDAEVRATYTVDDFVLAGRRRSDQSARELRYEVEAEHAFVGGLRLLAEGGLSDLRLGRLLWDTFAEIPFDTLRTYQGWIHVQAHPFGRLTADVGVRFFIRSDADRAVTVRYVPSGSERAASVTRPGRIRIEQLGPTCALTWSMRGGSALRLSGWLNVQHTWQRLYGRLPDADAARIRQAGRRGQRLLVPNLALTVLWNL